jgi:flavodoxin
MLWMHQRPKGESREEILPLGNFLDVEIVSGEVYGVPAFDMTDTFAVSIYNKVENGTIRMASAGLLPLEWERDAAGEIWLTKSQLVETTICDIGSNPEALAVKLYDADDKAIQLSADYFQSLNLATKTKSDMKLIELKADELFPLLGLADNAKADEAFKKINELVTLTTTQGTQLKKLKADVQGKLDEQINLANTAKIKDLVSKAGPEGDKKITADQVPIYEKLAATDFEGTKAALDSMAGHKSVKDILDEKKSGLSAELQKLSWDELYKSGKLETLKREDFEGFKSKYKEKFDKDFVEA